LPPLSDRSSLQLSQRLQVFHFMRRLLVTLLLLVTLRSDAFAQKGGTGTSVRKPSVTRAFGPRAPRTPPDALGRSVLAQADRAKGMKILVSTEDRFLWLVAGRDTIMQVPVAVGMGKSFAFEGQSFHFDTPRGKRTVLSKSENPLWNVPEWHYLERASQMNYKLVRMDRKTKYLLKDGTFLLTIGDNVGRLNLAGHFWAFTPGLEIMFDKTVFMPPADTKQRLVPDALGPYKLDTGDGYLLHGTHIYNEDSIGDAVSHGCVRLRNEDLDRLYSMVPVGTPVYIF
jgi:lipoprotein-anchoring transpeptidase ErfK/SrfK